MQMHKTCSEILLSRNLTITDTVRIYYHICKCKSRILQTMFGFRNWDIITLLKLAFFNLTGNEKLFLFEIQDVYLFV